MSVSNQTNKTNGSGNGVTTTFSFPFKIFDVSELVAYKIAADSTVTGPLTYTTDYTATINSVTEGGTITFIVAPASGTTWFLKRLVPYTQSAVIPSEGTLPGKQIENQLDLITMMVIQANETISRALVLPTTFIGSIPELPTPQDGYALGWLGTTGTLQNLLVDSAAITAGVVAAQAAATAASASASTASSQATAATSSASTASTQATAAAASAVAAAASANPSYIKCSNTQSSGTSGGTATSGSWLTATINTKDNDTGSIGTLTSNQLALPAGTYHIFCDLPFYDTSGSQIRLYNVTDSALILTGTSTNTDTAASASTGHSFIIGRFTLASAKTIRIEYQVSSTKATSGQGVAQSFGPEVYLQMELTKVA